MGEEEEEEQLASYTYPRQKAEAGQGNTEEAKKPTLQLWASLQARPTVLVGYIICIPDSNREGGEKKFQRNT